MQKFQFKTICSEEFKAFVLEHFKGSSALEAVDWQAWMYTPGEKDCMMGETRGRVSCAWP